MFRVGLLLAARKFNFIVVVGAHLETVHFPHYHVFLTRNLFLVKKMRGIEGCTHCTAAAFSVVFGRARNETAGAGMEFNEKKLS